MRFALFFAMFLAIAGCAAAQAPAAGKSKAISAESSVDEVLDALQARGLGLEDFSASISMTVIDTATGDEYTRSGNVWYQLMPDQQARLRATLDKKTVEDKTTEDKIEYLLEGPWLIDRNYRKRIEVKRQVLRPGEKFNLFNLGEGGPFPLPIGQDKAEVHKLFDVEKIAAAKDDPADTVHLRLTPKKDSRFARKLAGIDVWVSTMDHMPKRIDTLDVNQTTTRSTLLENVKVNSRLADADFALPAINDQWTRHEEAYTE